MMKEGGRPAVGAAGSVTVVPVSEAGRIGLNWKALAITISEGAFAQLTEN
jgi:hypothetical protein